jgi:hypothetical protein
MKGAKTNSQGEVCKLQDERLWECARDVPWGSNACKWSQST